MDVVVSDEAREFATARGGVVYVRSHSHRCCSGPITLLDTTTDTPPDTGDFVGFPAAGLTVQYLGDLEAGPTSSRSTSGGRSGAASSRTGTAAPSSSRSSDESSRLAGPAPADPTPPQPARPMVMS